MKDIEILELHLKNFKGIKSLSIPFNKVTSILGQNATGKTTIVDSFDWLLFDKDSTDRKNFEIKTLDMNNEPIHGLEHSVTGILSINGKKKTLQKVYKEKWQKKRGEADSTFTGHETLYYINDVPVKKTEYEEEIYLIADEAMFKLLTNPLYFSQSMKWQERREVLMQMNGTISNEDIIGHNPELGPLRSLLEDTDIDSLRKILSARKRKLNDDIKSIPFRIDECNNSILQHDFEAIRAKLNEKESRLSNIEEQLVTNTQLDSARAAKINKASALQSNMNQIERKAENEIYQKKRDAENDLRDKEYKLQQAETKIHNYRVRWSELQKEQTDYSNQAEGLREEWFKEKQKDLTFDDQFICPTCNRLLEAEDIEQKKSEMRENFNAEKAKNLERNVQKGKQIRSKVEDIANQMDSISVQIENEENIIETLKDQVQEAKDVAVYKSSNTCPLDLGEEYDILLAGYNKLQKELDKPGKAKEQILQLMEEKKMLKGVIDELKSQLTAEENNKKLQDRIESLSNQERELSQQIAETEGQEFLTEKFIKAKVEMVESEINSRFKTVNFKLFSTNINGGIEPTCEPLIQGVPFSDANNAAKINAGLDIINALSEHYQLSCPVFIDNREAVNEIIPTTGQLVNLIVAKLYKCNSCNHIQNHQIVCEKCNDIKFTEYEKLKVI